MRFSCVVECILLIICLVPNCLSVVLHASGDNFTSFGAYKIVLLQYYADWCHFSRQLTPIFEEASEVFLEHTKRGEVAFARIDCEASGDFCSQHGIRKYPTVKLMKYGIRVKREYRGPRTKDALVNFVMEHLNDSMVVLDAKNATAKEVWSTQTDTRDLILGIFPQLNEANPHLQHFRKAAFLERENCSFRLVHNIADNVDRLAYRESMSNEVKEVTTLKEANFPTIHKWIQDRCISPVRELTFANAEEIADEGLPFLVLFYDDKSAHLRRNFYELVKNHLQEERRTVNFLTADGIQFSHPLSHLNKTPKDLPLICIDSLVHMFQHPLPVETILSDPAILKQFVADLHSEKLHREFHYGPDPVTPSPEQRAPAPGTPENINAHGAATPEKSVRIQATTPAQSVFKRLGPSPMRYSMLHDEF